MAGISIGSVSVTVVPEVRRFATEVRRQTLPQAERIGREVGRRIAEGINEQVDRIQIRVSMGQTMARLARLEKTLNRLDGREVNLKINVDFGDSLAKLQLLQQVLRGIDRRITINIRTDADRSIPSLLRLGNSAGTATRGIGGLRRGILGLPWPALATGAIAGGAGLIQLAANLAPVIGLTAAIPAVAASAVAAFGTLALAFTGASAAASSVKRELKGVQPELRSVQAAASSALFTPLRGQITAVAAAITGPLRTGVRGVAREFGLAGRSALQFARSTATVRSIRVGFAGLRDVIRELRPALVPLLTGFRDLSIAAIPALKGMAAGTADLVTRFGQWMSQLAASGRVPEIIANALSVLRSLGSLLADVGGIIRSVFEAARQAGSGLFGILGPALDQLNAFLKTAAAQQALQAFFYSINAIGRALAPIVGIIGSVAAQLLNALYPVVQAALPFVNQLVAAFGRVVASLTPILAPLGSVIASLLTGLLPILTPIINLIAQTAVQLGGALVQALQQTLPSLQQIVLAAASVLPAFAPLIPLIPRLLMAVLPLLPVVAQLSAFLATLLAPVLRLVATVITAVATTIATVLTPVLRFLVAYLSIVATAVRLYFTGIQLLVRAVGFVFQWLWVNAVGPALRGIGAAALWLWRTAIVPAFNAIRTAALFLWHNAIQPAFAGITTAIRVAWGIIRPVFNLIVSVVRGVLGVAFIVLRNTVKTVWIAIQIAIKLAWAIIRPIWNAIRNHLAGPLAAAFRGFRSTNATVWNAIRTAINVAWGIIRGIWNAIRTHLLGPFAAAFRGFRSTNATVWSAVRGAISTASGTIQKIFTGLKTAVGKVRDAFKTAVDAIGRIWNNLKEIAKKPVNFVIKLYNDGIVNLVNKIASVAGIKTRLDKIGYFARGGILPGYSPGRDSMLAAVSPGESIFRPEFTRAVGPGFVREGNDIARRRGPAGVRNWLTGRDALSGEGLAFAHGGVVPGFAGHYQFGGIIGDFIQGVKDFTIGNIAKGAKKLLDKILGATVPGSGLLRDVIAAIPGWLKTNILKWIKDKVSFGGGPGIDRAIAFAKSQHGKPYQWGGVGDPSWDCCIIGPVRIYGPKGATPIQDVRAGDEVFSYVDGKITVQRVTAAWKSKTQRVYKVRTRNRAVTASANHPFMRLVMVEPYRRVKGGKRGEHIPARYDVEWVRLDELKRGDLLVQPRAMDVEAEQDPTLPDGTPVTSEIAWLLGLFIGDGYLTGNTVRICVYDDSSTRAQQILRDMGVNSFTSPKHGVVASSVALVHLLGDEMGLRVPGPEKRVPAAVWTWSRDLRQAFLDGYCDADGHHPADPATHGERTYASASRELLEDVRALHIMLGHPVSNISTNQRTKPIVIKGVLVKNARPLHTFTVWAGKGRGEVVLRRVSRGLAAWLDSGDCTLAKVLEISDEGVQDTYDLEVAEAHNFVADGVVVHNSGFMSGVTLAAKGKNPFHRRLFTTMSFTGAARGPAGFVRNARSGFTVGISNGASARSSHMAGTLAGKLNVESGGSGGVRAGGGARGTSSFPLKYGLKLDDGGFLPVGASLVYNGTGRPEPVLTADQFSMLTARGDRKVSVMEGATVIVQDPVDVDMLAQRAEFAARSASF